jgi:hypothetical protein
MPENTDAWKTPAQGEPPFTEAELLVGAAHLAAERLRDAVVLEPPPRDLRRLADVAHAAVYAMTA